MFDERGFHRHRCDDSFHRLDSRCLASTVIIRTIEDLREDSDRTQMIQEIL